MQLSSSSPSFVPSAIVNAFSTTGCLLMNLAGGCNSASKLLLSGALAAGVFAPVLSITGSGELGVVALSVVDATARTIGLRVTLDGKVVFETISGNCNIANIGLIAVGICGGATGEMAWDAQKIRFNSSCLIEVCSSLTETNKLRAILNYMVG